MAIAAGPVRNVAVVENTIAVAVLWRTQGANVIRDFVDKLYIVA